MDILIIIPCFCAEKKKKHHFRMGIDKRFPVK